MAILNNNNYEVKNAEYEGQEGSFYYYSINDYSSTIYDEFFD